MQTQNSSTSLTTKGSATIVVFVILLFTLVGTAVYFKNFPITNVLVAQPQSQTEVKTTTTTPIVVENKTSIDTSSWKTYKNTKYGLEFLYPADYVYEFFDADKPTDYSQVPEEYVEKNKYLEPVKQIYYFDVFTSSSTLANGVHGESPVIRIIINRNDKNWTIPQYNAYLSAAPARLEVEKFWSNKPGDIIPHEEFKGKEMYRIYTGCCGALFNTMILSHKGRFIEISGPNEGFLDPSELQGGIFTDYQNILASMKFF